MRRNVRGETEAEALKRRIAEARTETKQEFCSHPEKVITSTWYQGSQEYKSCGLCGKGWWD